MFKVIPAWITPDGRKVPLISGWKEAASNDPGVISLWNNLYKDRLKYWAIPTGSTNGILVLDVDAKGNGYDSIKNFQIPHTLTQRTLSGGLHFIFKLPQDGRRYGNRVGFMPGLDIRGESGYIMYYGFQDPNVGLAEAPPWLFEQALKQEHIHSGPAVQIDPVIAERIVLEALENIRSAPSGESNNVLNTEAFRLGQLIASGSISYEYAEQALYKAAVDRGKPAYEAKATIASGLKGGNVKPITSPFNDQQPVTGLQIPAPPVIERWTPRLFAHEDLLNFHALKKPQLFKDWSSEDITITTADGGTGKTTLKLYEAVCLALGVPFLGFQCVQQGKTLFITGEDTQAKLGAMIGRIVRQMGLFEDVTGNKERIQQIIESVVVKKESDMCLIFKDRSGFIHPNPEALRKVLEAVNDIKPKMIVFDPISTFWGSEAGLNDMARAVTKFMSELTERSGACVEMINHMGKQSSSNKDMSQFAGRGGTGLPSNSRVSRVLRPVFEEEFTELTGESLLEKQSAMMCVVNKFSDGSSLYNKPFLILRDEYLFARKNLTPQKEKEAEQQLTDTERIMDFVRECRANNKYPSEKVVIGHFQTCGNPISTERSKRAIDMLMFQGSMGEVLKLIDNPDATMKSKVLVITDARGKEISPS